MNKIVLPEWFNDIQQIQNRIDDEREMLTKNRKKVDNRSEGVGDGQG